VPTEKLQRAIGAIHVRFGGHALVQANRLPPAQPWPTGLAAVDRLSGIGGLPRGRVSVLQGEIGSGKLSLALALLASASREHARTIVIDRRGEFDPWVPDRFGADLGALTVIRPPTVAVAGEAAVALARAGAGFGLVLGVPPDAALGPLESAAARSGSLVLVVAGGPSAERRALAHASSLTLELEALGPLWERGLLAGVRSLLRCVKNKLAAAGAEAELEVRYPPAPALPPGEVPREVERGEREPVVELWPDASAAG
jgi:recA bacterial DNA recombination protein